MRALHSQDKTKSFGATSYHPSDRAAGRALARLEKEALSLGWRYCQVVLLPERGKGPEMRMTADGRRLFLSARTGEYVADESAFNPPLLPCPNYFIQAKTAERAMRKLAEHWQGVFPPER